MGPSAQHHSVVIKQLKIQLIFSASAFRRRPSEIDLKKNLFFVCYNQPEHSPFCAHSWSRDGGLYTSDAFVMFSTYLYSYIADSLLPIL
jgi:hypothetical protein